MKKNNSFYFTLLCIPVFAMLFLSYSSGQTVYYVSGSLSDNMDALNEQGNGLIGNCSTCHTGNVVIANSSTISLNAPSNYELNTRYSITVSSSSSASRQGFQMSVEDTANMKVGDFEGDGFSTQAFVSPIVNRGEAITNTGNGSYQNSWTFDWTSPAANVGPVTFYVALNESNFDNNTTGDQIHLKQSSSNLLSTENAVFKDIKVYPNPVQDFVTIDLPVNLENTKVTVFDFLGKQILVQDVTAKNKIDVSVWQSGVYLVQIKNDKASITKRFVKQ
ncbi:choice-of-anchor V domain-containing protein [Lacinutrix himadriensis]|uniref:choice-of-anchor V domain-containing protein n=1 Tax=Lacinutrix himadriensis TaxID=641549 RepID=UPI0009FA87F1|nr:choice-of-anchor V domain-containing protein [Lacinutrix himadriensis]